MCGIFGFSLKYNKNNNIKHLKNDIAMLYKLSERRGVEASGFAFQSNSSIAVFKKAIPAFEMTKRDDYNLFFDKSLSNFKDDSKVNFIAHSRLATNGVQADNKNNQPAISQQLSCVHNGIVTNTKQILKKYPLLEINSELDTEVLLKLINYFYEQKCSIIESVQNAFIEIEGYTNIALLDDQNQLLLSTNNGSVYYLENDENFVFASEKFILNEYIKNSNLDIFKNSPIKHLQSGSGILIGNNKIIKFELSDTSKINYSNIVKNKEFRIESYDDIIEQKRKSIKRCTKCILPATMPFIEFNEHGVCNYCSAYKPKKLLGKNALIKQLDNYIGASGKPEVVFAFSGGRDSCYALHYMVKELGIKPIAYSYDWGMITDLGRRNQSRLLGKLGVEHVVISANIREKRNNIRKNVEAWLKKPDLGMIPLIIAGDKQMFYYAQQVQHNYDAKAFLFSTNYLEKTDFKTGFANVNTVSLDGLSMSLTRKNKYAMIWHYLKNFIQNPSYINSSLFDTFDAFTKYYNKKADERVEFYDYIKWDEETINQTLINEYNWETSPDTTTTWRIGDGTAAFYNYIYYTVAGFTENDTFRSNQIREGVLSREKALELINSENQPRWQTIKEYCSLIQVDFIKAIEVIDSMKKHYVKE